MDEAAACASIGVSRRSATFALPAPGLACTADRYSDDDGHEKGDRTRPE